MKYFIYFMPFILSACIDKPISTETALDNNKVIKDHSPKEISLQSFTELPSAIDGCSGLFSAAYDTSKGSYIFVTDLQGKAWIKINDKLLQLTRISQNNKDSLIRETYKSQNITIAFTALLWKQIGDEVWLYEGDIFVFDGKETEHILLAGEIGC